MFEVRECIQTAIEIETLFSRDLNLIIELRIVTTCGVFDDNESQLQSSASHFLSECVNSLRPSDAYMRQ